MNAMGIPAVFFNSEQKDDAAKDRILRGDIRVVFICAEMLESASFAEVLHSPLFKGRLLAICLDEAHLVHESHRWRSSYAHLRLLRPVIGSDVPFVAISATLPTSYRVSLCQYAGLKVSHALINLGNYRPELSLVVMLLKYDASSFQDLAFVVPLGSRREHLRKTIIYCDDIDMIYKMFFWFQARLNAMGLRASLVDMLHASLSEKHENIALTDFRTGRTQIVLGTEKIGADMNLPGVRAVVQYLPKNDLTLAKLDQRRGRGARSAGSTAIVYLLHHPDLLEPDKSKNGGHRVDDGVMELIQWKGCYQDVLDKRLENPPRPPSSPAALRTCSSNYYPHLLPTQEFRFVMQEFSADAAALPVPVKKRDDVFQELCRLRTEAWRTEWKTRWPHFGPKSLIADEDLENLARVAWPIKTTEDLRPHVKIVYWSDLAPWLVTAVRSAVDASAPEQPGRGG